MTQPKSLSTILQELESKQRVWWIDELSGRFGPWEQIEDMTWPNDEGIIKVTDTPNLLPALKLAVEALETLKVAVNDKVEDKGATAFCQRTLTEIARLLNERIEE